MNNLKETKVIYNFAPPENSWIFRGSQKEHMNGEVVVSKVHSIRQRLANESAPGITFNAAKIGDTVMGGTCSAMSLAFIKKYFFFINSDQELLPSLLELKSLLGTSCLKMRTRQAAFNTIEVIKEVAHYDIAREKVESLVHFNHYHVTYATPVIDTQNEKCFEQLRTTLAEMPEGVYFVRILKPCDNDKQEVHGHSMVYIKASSGSFYYDPNNGAINLTEQDHAAIIQESFKYCFAEFQVTEARFYKLN